MRVTEFSRASDGFYEGMGPLFGSREVAKEVGIHLYDDADKRWFVAHAGREFIGCASVRGRVVSDCYVKPQHRRQGAFTAILQSLLNATSGPLRANCTQASTRAFKKAGFMVTRETANFSYMELDRA